MLSPEQPAKGFEFCSFWGPFNLLARRPRELWNRSSMPCKVFSNLKLTLGETSFTPSVEHQL